MKLTKTSKVGPTLLGARESRNFLKINIFMRKKKKKRDTMAVIRSEERRVGKECVP